MINTVRNGVKNTAMMSFAHVLNQQEIEAVVDFVRENFMLHKKKNTRYHTVENGWLNLERYKAAFPFVRGEIPLDTPWEQLTAEQRIGKQLFLSACVSCHDRVTENNAPLRFEPVPLSYPRNYSHKTGERIDATSSATPYAAHDIAPKLSHPDAKEKQGEALFQKNCAFCHAMDGTGKNWIGSFLEPHPRNFTARQETNHLDSQTLRRAIHKGVANTAMPAWEKVLSDEQIDAVAYYIEKTFLKR